MNTMCPKEREVAKSKARKQVLPTLTPILTLTVTLTATHTLTLAQTRTAILTLT